MTPNSIPSSLEDVTITESRPSELLAALHESADAEREYLFASREAVPGDLILVAWLDHAAVGYLAATDERADGMLIWEHLVVPAHRARGLGRRLLHEAAKRAVPESQVLVDPAGELDFERTADYYQRFGFSAGDGARGVSATASVVAAMTRPTGQDETSTAVSVLLAGKAPGVVTLDPHATVAEAIAMLNQARIGAVVLSTDGSRVEGICSERDILVALDRRGADVLREPVSSIATADVVTCTADDMVSTVMASMTRDRVRHVPVTDTGRLAGLVSLGDIVFHRLNNIASSPDAVC